MIFLKRLLIVSLTLFIACFAAVGLNNAQESPGIQENPSVAIVNIDSHGISFMPVVGYSTLSINIATPDGTVVSRVFQSGFTPYFSLSDIESATCLDGIYKYELRISPNMNPRVRNENSETSSRSSSRAALSQSGFFTVRNGAIVQGRNLSEAISRTNDVVHADDVIIQGSLCVGFDCVNNENFSFDTIRLKENNLRIHFDDTSSTAGFPATDWRIVVNDSSSGGGNYFSIQDATNSKTPFLIEGNAPSNSLYVDDYGRIGIKTATPVLEFHIKDTDTPSMRLEQDNSGGWTAQTWDIAGNEANFFIRDVTGGSRLPFRIQPGAPSNSIGIKSDGKVGIGTWSPAASLEIEATGIVADLRLDRTDGANAEIASRQNRVTIGSINNYNTEIITNNTARMTINTSGQVGIGTSTPTHKLEIQNGAGANAYCDGGNWVNGSSREFKTNIRNLTTHEAIYTLEKLNPVRFKYKGIEEEEYLGFIAEDVPDLVAMKDRKGMSPMDVVAVLTKVVQSQQITINQLKKKIEKLEQKQ